MDKVLSVLGLMPLLCQRPKLAGFRYQASGIRWYAINGTRTVGSTTTQLAGVHCGAAARRRHDYYFYTPQMGGPAA